MHGRPPTPWHHHPKAAALLTDCAIRPPATVTLRYRWGDERTTFTKADPRVAGLRRLYRAARPPIDTPAWSHWLRLDEQAAIHAAIAAGAQQRRAA